MGGDVIMTLVPTYVSAEFDPQPDITAYELAQIILHSGHMTEERWAELGPKVTRHMRRGDPPATPLKP